MIDSFYNNKNIPILLEILGFVKLLAWDDDACMPDGIYGHTQVGGRNVLFTSSTLLCVLKGK